MFVGVLATPLGTHVSKIFLVFHTSIKQILLCIFLKFDTKYWKHQI